MIWLQLDTLRYYERIGLLGRPERSRAGIAGSARTTLNG